MWKVISFAAFVFIAVDARLQPPPGYQPGDKSVRNPKPNEDHANYLAKQRLMLELMQQRPEMWKAQQDKAVDITDNIEVPWTCPSFPPSTTVPTSVHALRPGDIKVIGALGDSITAANGVRARNLLEVAATNRGESWSIGGEKSLEDGVLTIPNILRHFNPNITGYSTCRHWLKNKLNSLNVAVPGDTNRGMAAQAYDVMVLMLEDEAIDYWNDWKIITIFIGGNDLCGVCNNWDRYSPEAYYNGIKAALDLFYDHLPRAIINIQPMFDLSVLKNMMIPGQETFCKIAHQNFCSCVLVDGLQKQIQMEYFDKMVELTDGRYDARSDFTVVLQPHLRDISPWKFPNGTYDMSFVAPDCFHPSHKGHQMFAYMLWNTMLTPVGMKTTNYTISEGDTLEYKCPTEANPYIFTNCNSNRPDLCGLSKEDQKRQRRNTKDV